MLYGRRWRCWRNGHNPRKTLVVITDGSDYHSRHTTELLNAVRDSDVQIYGVAIHYQPFSMKRFGNGLLQSLANASGGLSFEISSPKRLPEMVDEVADATRSLYRIGFSHRLSTIGDAGTRFRCFWWIRISAGFGSMQEARTHRASRNKYWQTAMTWVLYLFRAPSRVNSKQLPRNRRYRIPEDSKRDLRGGVAGCHGGRREAAPIYHRL
jgi:hypothetical protein